MGKETIVHAHTERGKSKMSMFDPKLKGNNSERNIPKRKKTLSRKELAELESLRHQLSDGTLNPFFRFGPLLTRAYLDSEAGQNLEERIHTAISQS